jgi:hypothetical protein
MGNKSIKMNDLKYRNAFQPPGMTYARGEELHELASRGTKFQGVMNVINKKKKKR